MSLFGGRFWIPPQKLDHFYSLIADDSENGRPNWFVEKLVTNCASPLVIDADAETEHRDIMAAASVSDKEWDVYYRALVRFVADAYAGEREQETFSAIFLKAPDKIRTRDGKRWLKSGRHVVFPDVHVDSSTAPKLRMYLMQRFTDEKVLAGCPFLSKASMGDLFDKSVFDKCSNGIRMPYNHKAHKCVACDRLRQTQLSKWRSETPPEKRGGKQPYYKYPDCKDCNGESYVDEGRPYVPVEVLRQDGTRDVDMLENLRRDARATITLTSIRLSAGRVEPYKLCAEVAALVPTDTVGGGRRHGTASGTSTSSGGGYRHVHDEAILRAVDRCVSTTFPAGPGDAHCITETLVSASGEIYKVTSLGGGCHNKPKSDPRHNRSGVYYIITQKGVRQHCHSTKPYGKDGGECRGTPSGYKRVTLDVLETLFAYKFDLSPLEPRPARRKLVRKRAAPRDGPPPEVKPRTLPTEERRKYLEYMQSRTSHMVACVMAPPPKKKKKKRRRGGGGGGGED